MPRKKSEEENKQRTEKQKEKYGTDRERIHHLSNRVKARLNSGSPDTEKGLTSDYDDK